MEQQSSESPTPSEQAQLSDTERWASFISGGALVFMGLRQRSLRGALMAIAGGGLAYHAASGQKSLGDRVGEAVGLDKTIKVEKSATIANKTSAELYRIWRNFENLPIFMKHLKSVTVLDEQRSHWVANAPASTKVEWDAEIMTDQENWLIAWASVEGSDIENSGFVRFQPAPEGRGTEVKVVLEYEPPAGVLGAAVAKLFGEEPEQQIGDDLRRFKQWMEAGEVATTDGQPSGRS
jgi:uncharacterized membrane protein